jgi:hypothetical protein
VENVADVTDVTLKRQSDLRCALFEEEERVSAVCSLMLCPPRCIVSAARCLTVLLLSRRNSDKNARRSIMAVQSNSSGDFSSLLAAMGQLRERSGARVRTIDSHQLTKNPFFFFFFFRRSTTQQQLSCAV